MTPVMRRVRGKVAIYNENLRAIAARHDAVMADMWALRELHDPRMWAPDRLHFSPVGHNTVARMVLDALGVENSLEPFHPEPLDSVRVATGPRRGHRMGPRLPRALGAASRPPPVLRGRDQPEAPAGGASVPGRVSEGSSMLLEEAVVGAYAGRPRKVRPCKR